MYARPFLQYQAQDSRTTVVLIMPFCLQIAHIILKASKIYTVTITIRYISNNRIPKDKKIAI